MLKVVLVGAGFIAESHLKGYLQLSNAQVVAVADVDAARARRLAALAGGVRWATDYHDVLRVHAHGESVEPARTVVRSREFA